MRVDMIGDAAAGCGKRGSDWQNRRFRNHGFARLRISLPCDTGRQHLGRRTDTIYWDTISREWTQKRRYRLWRTHSDGINSRLLIRWLPAERVDPLLKTDLFDELVSEGIYPLLERRANRVFCIDTSLFALGTVQGWPAGPRKLGSDVRCLPFANGAFNVIVSNSTLDHFDSVDEIASSLRELHRVLRSGGLLILTLDNPANPAIFLRNRLPFQLLHGLGIVPYYVGVSLRPSHLQNLLEKTGFEILEVDAVMHCPRVLAVAVSNWIEKRFGSKCQNGFFTFFACLRRPFSLADALFDRKFHRRQGDNEAFLR